MAGPAPAQAAAGSPAASEWTGRWAAERLGVTLSGPPELTAMLGLAVRDNPRRAHLLVSGVLGKHVPARPAAVYGAGLTLGRRVRDRLGPHAAARAVVLGYAETATALGHSVADGLGPVPYLHSTRRPVPGVPPAGGFEEPHSHATGHLLLPEDPALLAGEGPLVLVDDEFSTGTTVLNTVTALHRRAPRTHYVIAALADLRTPDDRRRLAATAARLGVRVEVVALATGRVRLPDDVRERGRALVAAHRTAPPPPAARHRVERVDLGWPAGVPDGGRHGFTPAHADRLAAALPGMAERLRAALPRAARRILVLGCEELMYAPLRLAAALDTDPGRTVHLSSTTRSPVLAVDDPGYPIRTALAFPAHDRPADGPGPRYAYNVAPGRDAARRFDAVVAVLDAAADTPELHAPGGLAAHLAAHTDRLLLAVVPSHLPGGHLPGGHLPSGHLSGGHTPRPATERRV